MSKKQKIYYPIDKHTKEVLAPVNAEYRGGLYHIPKNALEVEPLPEKDGFVVVACEFDEIGKPHSTKYLEDHRSTTIYDESDCTKSEIVSELGPIKVGFTPDKPKTEFDERINGIWVTNISDKYIAEYNAVDERRRVSYRNISDPLYMESIRKELNGLLDESRDFKKQANEAVKLIQLENPFPIMVEVI